jgi:hypothetical protein
LRFGQKQTMTKNSKPDDPLAPPEPARSLGIIALGVTEYLFLLGVVLLAAGLWLVFGFPAALIGVGAVLIGAAFYNAQVG